MAFLGEIWGCLEVPGVWQLPGRCRSFQRGWIKCLPEQGVRQRDILGPGKSQWGYFWHQHQSAQGSQVPAEEREIFGSISSNKANEDLNPRITLNSHVFATKNIDGGKRGPLGSLPARGGCSWNTFPLMLPCLWQLLQLKAWVNELMGSSNHSHLW